MLAAAEKDIAHMPMILDHAPQLPFHLVVAVFENLLKLVEHHHYVELALRRNEQSLVARPEVTPVVFGEREILTVVCRGLSQLNCQLN